MILSNGRWKIRNSKTNRLVLTTSKLGIDIIRENAPFISNDCLEIIAKMSALDVFKVSKFFKNTVEQQINRAKSYGRYLKQYLIRAIHYFVHRKITLYGYDGHDVSIEFKDDSTNKRTFTITSSYDNKSYTFTRCRQYFLIDTFHLRAMIPITFARKINNILNSFKNFSTNTYFRVNKNKCYMKWILLGRPDREFKLFDIYAFSNRDFISIKEPCFIKAWAKEIEELNNG